MISVVGRLSSSCTMTTCVASKLVKSSTGLRICITAPIELRQAATLCLAKILMPLWIMTHGPWTHHVTCASSMTTQYRKNRLLPNSWYLVGRRFVLMTWLDIKLCYVNVMLSFVRFVMIIESSSSLTLDWIRLDSITLSNIESITLSYLTYLPICSL